MNVTSDLYCQALDLPPDQRSELALILLESLPEDVDPPIELDPEYEAEIRRRIAASQRGEAQLLSLAETMALIRQSPDVQSSP